VQNERDIDKRVYEFTISIINFVRSLPSEMAARELGRQLLRSGTSIAANIEEARGGFSKEDFTYKMSVAFKEARETNLWLRLLCDTGIVSTKKLDGLLTESAEIRNILGATVKTSRSNRKGQK
jgi:four helix bundle protein